MFHSSLSAQDPALRVNLDRAYEQWRAAILAQDARAWAAAITQYRQVVTRNLIVSQRQPFPQAVFAVPLDPPEISGLRLLEAQAVGETAHLLYFGKVNMGGDPGQIPESVLMLKFFYERGAWRFDSSKILKILEQPEIVQQIKSGGRLEFLDYPEFTPPGTAPTVPPLCGIPENMAGCTLQSYGYETKMRINGFDCPVMADHAEKFFVIGGLKNGANDVTLTVKPTDIPAGEERLLQVDFFVLAGKAQKAPVRVFHYESKDAATSSPLKLPVIINEDVLSKGR
ncbi:hypothetical protein [Prosthecobacter fusiformis]|uniref:hypothetical protein n=1 Tax=Prosthecobacter fusiformis TaxID=48464 RepID=UPI00105E02D3|nr:hypothetical protein [Prosthecobacter fusiformis]